jgi:hypothetical protein
LGRGETTPLFPVVRTERREGGGVGRTEGVEKKNESFADIVFAIVGVNKFDSESSSDSKYFGDDVGLSVCARTGGRGRGRVSEKKEWVLE